MNRDSLTHMRSILLLAVSAASAFAQLAPPNDLGVSIGHVHLLVTDPDAQKKIWVDLLGGQPTKSGTLEMIRFPGVYVLLRKAPAPLTGGMDGSTVAHFGFLAKDIAGLKAKLDGLKIQHASPNGNVNQTMAQFPDGVVVEFTGDPSIATPFAMHHIHLASPNQEKIRDWYASTFGAKPGTRGQFLAALLPGGEVDTRPADKVQAPTKGRSLDHIGFEVKNLEAFCKKLEAQGVKFEMPYAARPEIDLKLAFLVDPEGTRIELTEGLRGK
jgi:catechol 2,3-dioxygenase-like lactoylglutathione lyase family enzyme